MEALDSPWTWVYVFDARHATAVEAALGDRPRVVTAYRVDRVAAVRGGPPAAIAPGTDVVRLEVAARWPEGVPPPLFRGVVRHQDYTGRAEREALAGSRPPLDPGPDTVAVLILVRKSAAWWTLPADDRAAHFRHRPGGGGHTTVGVRYADRVYRRLYHTRYAVDTADHDFLTYFEFARSDAGAFGDLLAGLRDPAVNPEWGYVDREYEVWMTRTR